MHEPSKKAPCMEYLPTCGRQFKPHVGKYSKHGAVGLDFRVPKWVGEIIERHQSQPPPSTSMDIQLIWTPNEEFQISVNVGIQV